MIANRGEIALRIMEACKDLGHDYVVVYTSADEDSKHVRLNLDSKSCRDKAWRVSSYTDPNDILAVADHTECTAIHPGYGFFSEDFRFARRATERDRSLVFIGPKWEVIKDLGDKINTKRVANRLGIPTIPGTDGPIYNEMEAEAIAEELMADQIEKKIMDPSILVKDSAGGGGRGMRVIGDAADLEEAFTRCSSEAELAFGDAQVYVEEYLPKARHVEVQILGDGTGAVSHFWERECSIQRRHQKLVEVAPSPSLSEKTRKALTKAAVKLAEAANYRGLGTIEFLLDSSGGRFAFMEANARLQVEHTVTEEVT
ncbi:MAG: ATP-grasp domain-containing protein, partial [Desulfobulbaceae bacterium]|nr:ATP-grasp domain-containing protein [Desulfobulbaceae bacterium]